MSVFHRHIWINVATKIRVGKVQCCYGCDKYQTLVFDYASNTFIAVPGIILVPSLVQTIYIVCGEDDWKMSVIDLMQREGERLGSAERLTRMEQLEGRINPTVFLYGRWYDEDICQNPAFTALMNGWL